MRRVLRSSPFASLAIFLAAASSAAAQCAVQWVPGEGLPGTDSVVQASTMWDPDGAGPLPPRMVVAGYFTAAGTVIANRIAAYEPVAGVWSTFGTGIDDAVYALATLPNGDLVAGGAFRTAGGLTVNHIARWNGSAWVPLGAGTNADVLALATLPNGDLVAGGEFNTAGSVPAANNIARWDGTTWWPLGTGTNGPVFTIAVLPNGDLVVGGMFDTAGGAFVGNVARWDGTSWSALGTGVSGGTAPHVETITVLPNGDLVAGGDFTFAGPIATNFVARWDGSGSVWLPLGMGMNDLVLALGHLPNGDLIAAGWFTQAGGMPADRLARWDGLAWSPLPGTNGPVYSLMQLGNGDMLAGGQFTFAANGGGAFLARLTTTCPALAVSAGSGCSGSGGANVLTAQTLPWIGAVFRSGATGMPGNGLALRVLGFATAATPLSAILPQGLPGCTLLVAPALLDLHVPASGSVATQLAIPNTIALASQTFHDQVVALEIAASGAITALTSTNALTLTIGAF